MERAEAEARADEMARQLHDLSEAIRHPRSLDWNPVQIKLTEETTDGPPAVGVSVVLTRMFENPPKTLTRDSDKAGLADFGALQPGKYQYQIDSRSNDGDLSTSGELTVQPGTEVNRHVVCPRIPPQRVGVRVRWHWPADLEKEPLLLFVPFNFNFLRSASGAHWMISRTHAVKHLTDAGIGPYTFAVSHSILGETSNGFYEFKDFKGLFLWKAPPFDLGSPYGNATKLGVGVFADASKEDLQPLKPPARPWSWRLALTL